MTADALWRGCGLGAEAALALCSMEAELMV